MKNLFKASILMMLISLTGNMDACAAEVKLKCKVDNHIEGQGIETVMMSFDETNGSVIVNNHGGNVNAKCTRSEYLCDEYFITAEAFGYDYYVEGKFKWKTSVSRMDGEYTVSGLNISGSCAPYKFKQAF